MSDTYEERPPLMLLGDALALCELALEIPPTQHGHHGSAARSAIMTAILALEATANCLIEDIEFPPRLMELIDQSPALLKYEFALFARDPKKTLDRGNSPVQAVRELFDIRNRFVHPKPQEHVISHRDLGDGVVQIEKTRGASSQLQLPPSPEDWGVRDAVRVLTAVYGFLDHFLIDLCGFSEGELGHFLLSRLMIDDAPKVLLPESQVALFARAAHRGLKSKALGSVLRLDHQPDDQRTEFLFEYSWSRGPMQMHQQGHSITIRGEPRLVDALTTATRQFFTWFTASERQLHGRDLIHCEIYSPNRAQRFGTYQIFIPLHSEPEAPTESRPIGRLIGVKRQIFANGIAACDVVDGTWRVTLLEDSGIGRVISMPLSEAVALRQLILNNSRPGWAAAQKVPTPERVETKGRDFQVARIEIAGYDPTSQTAFISYASAAANVVQINLSTSHLMTLLAELPQEEA